MKLSIAIIIVAALNVIVIAILVLLVRSIAGKLTLLYA